MRHVEWMVVLIQVERVSVVGGQQVQIESHNQTDQVMQHLGKTPAVDV